MVPRRVDPADLTGPHERLPDGPPHDAAAQHPVLRLRPDRHEPGGRLFGRAHRLPGFNAVEFNTVDRNLFVANAKSAFCAFGGSSNGKPFSGSTNHIAFTDNVFQKGANGTCGSYGPITDFDRNAPGNVWSGNRWDDGTSLDPPAK